MTTTPPTDHFAAHALAREIVARSTGWHRSGSAIRTTPIQIGDFLYTVDVECFPEMIYRAPVKAEWRGPWEFWWRDARFFRLLGFLWPWEWFHVTRAAAIRAVSQVDPAQLLLAQVRSMDPPDRAGVGSLSIAEGEQHGT